MNRLVNVRSKWYQKHWLKLLVAHSSIQLKRYVLCFLSRSFSTFLTPYCRTDECQLIGAFIKRVNCWHIPVCIAPTQSWHWIASAHLSRNHCSACIHSSRTIQCQLIYTGWRLLTSHWSCSSDSNKVLWRIHGHHTVFLYQVVVICLHREKYISSIILSVHNVSIIYLLMQPVLQQVKWKPLLSQSTCTRSTML